jgi:hypothetical protein
MDTDITHMGIIIRIVTPITGRTGTMDTITGPTIGTAATAFTIIRGTTPIIAGKHSPAAVKTVQIGWPEYISGQCSFQKLLFRTRPSVPALLLR